MAYQFYQNSKMVQSQIGQSEDAVNQSIQNSVEEYKQNFAQANYAYAINVAQDAQAKMFEKMGGTGELLAGTPALFNALKTGVPSAKNLVNKIRSVASPADPEVVAKPSPTPVSDGPTEVPELSAEPAGQSAYLPDTVDPATGERPSMTIPDESDIGTTGERTFDNPLFGEDLGVSTFADQVETPALEATDVSTASRQEFGTANYEGTQTGSEATPVLPSEQRPQTEVETPSTITTDTPAPTNVLDKTGSDVITSEVQETAGSIEKTASKSIWEEIGDTFADIGAAALDIVDPIADVVEAGVAVAGVALGAKALSESNKSMDAPPPTMQTQSLLQTSSISAVSQPGI